VALRCANLGRWALVAAQRVFACAWLEAARTPLSMPLLWLLLAFVAFQLGLRAWFRLRLGAIPYGWTWLLENPWRWVYRNLERTAE
jgi:hypothetical protein